ncbi:isoaspartyl peptidase/L-asparaginase [Gallaecimonas sp. GXIMD4217]|uniref:isoaspartyl peptidase/L-asparaginase family protein n=1 Tax=Gallaecimonas sp. GXIMD4217 TaxID=3131927 RepID=UPI00311B35B6
MRRLLCTLALAAMPLAAEEPRADFALAIHGGAGTILKENMSPEQEAAYKAKLGEALDAGVAVLKAGGQALEAVKAAIVVMEDSPQFNAGRGAVYTWDERHELDASLMDGRTLDAGAVAGVTTVKNPILAAHKVMTDSPHVMLSGSGADTFARAQGLAQVANSHFDTESRLQSLRKFKAQQHKGGDYRAAAPLNGDYKYGTVGAVALDGHGNLAAGTSTGGMTGKRWGRIGDSPVIGAGTYAENGVCAVSATGHGEYFIRYNASADICARIRYQGKEADQAGREVILDRIGRAGGSGGVIIIDGKGNIAMPFNTQGMYRASHSSRGGRQVAIYGH